MYVHGLAKEWSLGCVNLRPAARGSQEAGFTQPRKCFLCLSMASLAMYDVPKSVLATVFWPDGATCVIS